LPVAVREKLPNDNNFFSTVRVFSIVAAMHSPSRANLRFSIKPHRLQKFRARASLHRAREKRKLFPAQENRAKISARKAARFPIFPGN
jgi:hypothetical protein